MRDVQQGFRIGERLFHWGNRLDEVAGVIGQALETPSWRGYRSLDWPCTPTYGFDTVGVALSAPDVERPITTLGYDIAMPAGEGMPDPRRWTEILCESLGQPLETSFHQLPVQGDLAGKVRYHANWALADHTISLAAYGGPNKVRHGLSAGRLRVDWALVSAAKPFLGEWHARAAELQRLSDARTDIATFTFAEVPRPPLHTYVGDNAEALAERDAYYVLSRSELLPTPPAVATLLGSNDIALWRSEDRATWCISTHWESICFAAGEPVIVTWHNVLPARGGGYSVIQVGRWSIRDPSGSDAVRIAVEALAAIPGVTVNASQAYDC